MALDETGERGKNVRMTTALEDFRRARQRAALHELAARLQGKPVELLSFHEVSRALQIAGQAERGVQEIRVDRIVGSVGRYQDFDRSFLPRRAADAQRWAGLLARVPDLTTLPPIEVYQIGEVYFVSDGNHRVSLAHHLGAEFIAARVTEVQTRAPLPAELDPLGLVLAAEYADFLARTGLDRLRPQADVRLSLPGGYERLENHIEVQRFFAEMAEERPLSDATAVARWYDEAYLPLVETIRELGLLRGFPGRTETDLYLWLAEHQAALRHELGWPVSPQQAATALPAGDVVAQGLLGRLRQRRGGVTAAAAPWPAHRLLERYSSSLFAEVLVLLGGGEDGPGLAQAAWLARREEARLHGLLLAPKGNEPVATAERFEATVRDAGLHGELVTATEGWLAAIRRRAALVDLLVLCRAPALDARLVGALLRQGGRPLLFTAAPARPLRRVLLLLDGRAPAQQALFVGAYTAEAWGAELALLVDEQMSPDALAQALRYLALHECTPQAQTRGALTPQAAQAAAREWGCDLLLCAGYDDGPLAKAALGKWLAANWARLERPWLVCA